MKREYTEIQQLLIEQGHNFTRKPNIKQKWLRSFQKYCDSDEIRKESELNGINACGYGVQCEYCKGSEKRLACARAMVEFTKEERHFDIDYSNTSNEYFRELLLYQPEYKESE